MSALAVCPKRERLSYDQRSRDGLRDERDFDWSYGNDDPDAAEAKNLGPKGTITDFDGKFELKVPKAVKYVVVSFVGYKNAKLDVTKTTEFKVMLQPDQEQLTEVVVTGYQQIEKRKSTSAIQTVKMDDIKRIGVASIDQVVGRTSGGYDFNSNEWSPGAPNKMRIRSTVSLTGSTDPLWVLDGMIWKGMIFRLILVIRIILTICIILQLQV